MLNVQHMLLVQANGDDRWRKLGTVLLQVTRTIHVSNHTRAIMSPGGAQDTNEEVRLVRN